MNEMDIQHSLEERDAASAIAALCSRAEETKKRQRPGNNVAEEPTAKGPTVLQNQGAQVGELTQNRQSHTAKKARIDQREGASSMKAVTMSGSSFSQGEMKMNPKKRPSSNNEKAAIRQHRSSLARKRPTHTQRWDSSSMGSSSTGSTGSSPPSASTTTSRDEPAEASSMSDGGYEGGKSESNSGSGSGSDDGSGRNPHMDHLVQWSTHSRQSRGNSNGDDDSPVSSSSDAGSDEPESNGLDLSTEDPFPSSSGKDTTNSESNNDVGVKTGIAKNGKGEPRKKVRGYESSTGSDQTSSEREKSETTSSETISALSSKFGGNGSGGCQAKGAGAKEDNCKANGDGKRNGRNSHCVVNFSSGTHVHLHSATNITRAVPSVTLLAGTSVSSSLSGGGAEGSSNQEGVATKKSSGDETGAKINIVSGTSTGGNGGSGGTSTGNGDSTGTSSNNRKGDSTDTSSNNRKGDSTDTSSNNNDNDKEKSTKQKPAKTKDGNISSGKSKDGIHQEEGELRAAPYFYYVDHSREEDDDPLAFLTPPARVPHFPAKMHALLMRDDLRNVIRWMPHGRSFKIVNPREFELRVIPTYFEHSKISSFVRQAQGWGFRKLTKGRERHAFYNEYFLRGLPHLCKKMTRPSLTKKVVCDPDHEPDLFQVSAEHPVPERISHDDMNLAVIQAVGKCIMDGGPKARLPMIYSMNFQKSPSLCKTNHPPCRLNNDSKPIVPPPVSAANHRSSNNSISVGASKSLTVLPPSSSSASLSTVSGYFQSGDSMMGSPNQHNHQRQAHQIDQQDSQLHQQQRQQQQHAQSQMHQQQHNHVQHGQSAVQHSTDEHQNQSQNHYHQPKSQSQPNTQANFQLDQQQKIQALLQQQYLTQAMNQPQQQRYQPQQPQPQIQPQSRDNSFNAILQFLQNASNSTTSSTNYAQQPQPQHSQDSSLNAVLQLIQNQPTNSSSLPNLQNPMNQPLQQQQTQQQNFQSQDPHSFLSSLMNNNISSSTYTQNPNPHNAPPAFLMNAMQQQQNQQQGRLSQGGLAGTSGSENNNGAFRPMSGNPSLQQDQLLNIVNSLLSGQSSESTVSALPPSSSLGQYTQTIGNAGNQRGGMRNVASGSGTNPLQQFLAQATSQHQPHQVQNPNLMLSNLPQIDLSAFGGGNIGSSEEYLHIIAQAVAAGAQLGAEAVSMTSNSSPRPGDQQQNGPSS